MLWLNKKINVRSQSRPKEYGMDGSIFKSAKIYFDNVPTEDIVAFVATDDSGFDNKRITVRIMGYQIKEHLSSYDIDKQHQDGLRIWYYALMPHGEFLLWKSKVEDEVGKLINYASKECFFPYEKYKSRLR